MKFGMYVREEPTILHVEFGSDRPTGLAVVRFLKRIFQNTPFLDMTMLNFF